MENLNNKAQFLYFPQIIFISYYLLTTIYLNINKYSLNVCEEVVLYGHSHWSLIL